jgi:hypothetical protein
MNSYTLQIEIPRTSGPVDCRQLTLSGQLVAQWNSLLPGIHRVQVPNVSTQPYIFNLKAEKNNLNSTTILLRR